MNFYKTIFGIQYFPSKWGWLTILTISKTSKRLQGQQLVKLVHKTS
jgi:hypothetical protein